MSDDNTGALVTPLPSRVTAWFAARPWRTAMLAGFGGASTIGILASLNAAGTLPLLIAPFGASCVLVFGVPASPLAQPRNVIGGHLVTALMGLLATWALGYGPLGTAVGVGLAIAGMMLTGTVHPPAGANPIVVALIRPDWTFLAAPVALGACAIVCLGMAYHRLVTRTAYPSRA